ncbi:MAG: bacillithiol biosynthesis deacetylase BshB1 [Bacteroidetes bacterium]|nr:bacillithiol biosynthesis deacetylase BshB1 [Bacteroidota bacterium]
MKVDILFFGAHPDDVELSCGGTILKHKKQGKKIGIVDLTRGELGTRGSIKDRDQEAETAANILGVDVRDNLSLPDGFFTNEKKHQLEVIKAIRKYQPDIIVTPASKDRHPDHGKACELITQASFLSGLRMIETDLNGKKQEPWRANSLYHYIQYWHINPDFVIDITDFIETKMLAVKAYKSQFFDPNSKEPETLISKPEFLNHLYSRAEEYGKHIGVKYAEGFTLQRIPGVESFFDLK